MRRRRKAQQQQQGAPTIRTDTPRALLTNTHTFASTAPHSGLKSCGAISYRTMGGWVRHRGDAGSRHHMLMKVGTLMAVLFCMFALVLGARGPTRHSSSIPGNTRQGHVTRRFLITPRVAAVVSVVGDFFLCLEDAQTKTEVFCTSDTGGIETAWWVGTSLQRFFYEGYSVRVGAEVWRKKSSGVLVDSIAYDDELGGSGGGSLAFKVGLSLAYGFRSGEASVEVAAASDADPRRPRVRHVPLWQQGRPARHGARLGGQQRGIVRPGRALRSVGSAREHGVLLVRGRRMVLGALQEVPKGQGDDVHAGALFGEHQGQGGVAEHHQEDGL